MKFKQYLNEAVKTYRNINRNNQPKDIISKAAKKLGKGIYKIEIDGFKSNEADFTFKAKLNVFDDSGKWIIKKGKLNFYGIKGFKVVKSTTTRPNTFSLKDIETIRIE